MKKSETMSAERVSVVKNDPGCRLVPRSRTFEGFPNRGPDRGQKTMGKDHALKDRVRP